MDIAISIVFLSAIALYIRAIIVDKNFAPNVVSFGVWSVVDVANFVTITAYTKEWIAPFLMALGAVLCFVLSIFKAKKNKNELTKFDKICLLVCAIAFCIYYFADSPILANLLIQAVITIGFLPIIKSLLAVNKEPLGSWVLFAIGWILTIFKMLRSNHGLVEYVYPVITGLTPTLIVLFLAIYNHRKKTWYLHTYILLIR